MNIIITGYESGLGNFIYDALDGTNDDQVYGIGIGSLLRGKKVIDGHINSAIKRMGSVTHVINNAGINHLSWIGTTPEADEEILKVNTLAPYWVINALVAKGQTCRVVNVASITHRVPQRCTSLYCASKAALVHMTRVMARELAPKGWVINAIAPGPIDGTEMTRKVNEQVMGLRGWSLEEMHGYALKNIPAGRNTTKAEVYDAILGLLNGPEYINGTCLEIAGGA